MILTITLNPSIDYLYRKKTFTLGKTNKMKEPTRNVGGKGINAGRAAATMESEVKLTGFLGGENGELIEKLLTKENLFDLDFISLSGNSRNAITIMHDNDIHTEITEEGPEVNEIYKQKIISKINKILNENKNISIVCISGSVNTDNKLFYQEIVDNIYLKFPLLKIILDISGDQLESIINNKTKGSFMIKPNIHEYNELNFSNFETKPEIIEDLRKSTRLSFVPIVLVSCGGDGAVLKFDNNIYNISIPKIKIVNPTGAGDSTVGGFASSLEKGLPIIECVKYAMACGISNTQNKEVGKVIKEDVEELVKKIKIDIIPK